MEEKKILHLSDLHFGYRFNQRNWESILALITQERPDLVAITGDLVNTPWIWTMRRAGRAVRELEDRVRAHPSPNVSDNKEGLGPRVVLVPGNHDTRISGLIDIRWFFWFSVIFAAEAYRFFLPTRGLSAQDTEFYILLSMGLACLLLRALTTTDFHRIFGSAYIEEATSYAWLGLGIVPIDSSKTWAFGAQGKVTKHLRKKLEKSLGPPGTQQGLWIALVHHHPLPLPYDAKQESVMIMINAGLLLKELANYNIPLVLHGHKHHQHFSRILIEDSSKVEKCVSVLAAGTATEKKSGHPKPHSFNLLNITGHGTVDLTVYESDGEQSFVTKPKRAILTTEILAAQRANLMKNSATVRVERLVSLASIDEYGNCRVVREYSALANFSGSDLKRLSHGVEFSSEATVVTDVFADADNVERVTCVPVDEHALHEGCDINFDPPLSAADHEAIDFSAGYFAMNMCALNRWQFKNMYTRNDCREVITYNLPPGVSIRNFHLHLRFPSGVKLPSNIRLETLAGTQWVPCIACELTPILAVPIICATIKAPTPGTAYRFTWPVERIAHPPSQEWQKLCSALLDFNRLPPAHQEKLFTQLTNLADELLKEAGEQPSQLDTSNFCLSIYGYDGHARTLHRVGASNTRTHKAADSFRFGVGLPGMAMKTGQVMFYNKNIPYSRGTGRPWVNRAGHRRDSIDRENDGQEVIAVPLFDNRDLATKEGRYRFEGVPYGVLRLSVDGLSAKLRLHESSLDGVHATFCAAASFLVSEYVKAHLLVQMGAA